MKPYLHAKNSVRKYKGKIEDYLPIHELMDSSKSAEASVKHRCVFHSAFGIFIVEKIFGVNITNSDGKLVSVRDIAEDHVIEDCGTIPSLSDWLKGMPIESWMGAPKKKVRTSTWNEETENDKREQSAFDEILGGNPHAHLID